MVIIKVPIDEEMEDKLQALDDEFQELKAKISELRKKGKDTTIPELMILDFMPKLKMARATYDREDLAKLRIFIGNLKDEIRKSEEGTDFKKALSKIKDSYEYLRNNEVKEASDLYIEIRKLYSGLSPDLKRTLCSACFDLRERIEKVKGKNCS
jgi:hypothetical protein